MNSTALRRFACGVVLAFLLSFPVSTRADALDNWTTNQVSTNLFQLSHVVYGNGRFVAAGGRSDGGAIMSSEGGLNWTLRADGGCCGPPSLVWGLTYGGGRFVTVGHFGGTASSTDGINWTYGLANSVGLYGVAYGNGVYVGVGSDSPDSIFISTNGINWSAGLTNPNEVRDAYDVAFGTNEFGTGRFVVVAAGGYVYTGSGTGILWPRSSSPVGVGTRISYCRNIFIAPVSPGVNLVSTSGNVSSWATVNTGLSVTLGKPIFLNGLFWARAGEHLATSTDGTNWTQRTSSTLPGSSGVVSDGSRVVTVGAVDGSPFGYYNAFVYVSDPLVAIGIADDPPPQIVLSGVVGRSYRVEYLPSLPASATDPWQTLTNLILPSSPYLLADPEAPSSAQRFYRAVLLP